MKHPVTDEAFDTWVACTRAGRPTTTAFPGKMSDCDFSEAQKELIRKVRAERNAKNKALKKASIPPKIEIKVAAPRVTPTEPKPKPLNKLRMMLFLQLGKCFYCGETLTESEANIEHLQPLSRGGTRAEDNEVVCHKSINQVFGHMNLKQKVDFLLRSGGSLQCPKLE